MSAGKITVHPTATLIIAGNYERVALELENQDTVVISLSDDSAMDSTVGVTLQVGERRSSDPPGDSGSFFYKGPVYGAVASGTAVIRYVEWLTYRE